MSDYELDSYGEFLTKQVEKMNLELRVSELEIKLAALETENEFLKEQLKEIHIASHGRFPDLKQMELTCEDDLK